MDTSRLDGVKAPQHRGTPQSTVQRNCESVLIQLDVGTTHARDLALRRAAAPQHERGVVFSYIDHLREAPVAAAAAARAAARARLRARLVVAVRHLARLASGVVALII